MKRSIWVFSFALGLWGCSIDGLFGGDKESTPPVVSLDGNIQDWYFLYSTGSNQLKVNQGPCSEPITIKPIKYRVRGDSLDLGWTVVAWSDSLQEDVPADTFRLGGTYVREGSGSSVLGGWRLVNHRPWDAHAAASSFVQREIERWNFLYAGEELSIQPHILLIAYPRFWTSRVRYAEMNQLEDPSTVFQYIGKDSLRVSRGGETIEFKYKVFDFYRARSIFESYPPVNVSLTDSCSFVGTVEDSTWVSNFLMNTPDEFAKGASRSRRGSIPAGRPLH